MKLHDLRVCNLTEPLGFAMEEPVFSWTVEGAGGEVRSISLRIRAAGETVYDSGEAPSADSLGWPVPLRLLPWLWLRLPHARGWPGLSRRNRYGTRCLHTPY